MVQSHMQGMHFRTLLKIKNCEEVTYLKEVDRISNEEKLEMCVDRIKGMTVTAIADKHNTAPYNVSAVFRSFPCRYSSSIGTKPNLSDETMIRICELTIGGSTPVMVARSMGTTSSTVYRVYEFIRARRPKQIESPYYPAVTDWMNKNQITLRDFASLVEVHPLKLGDVLAGRKNQQLSYKLADDISSRTGLLFSEIFRVQIENEAKGVEGRA